MIRNEADFAEIVKILLSLEASIYIPQVCTSEIRPLFLAVASLRWVPSKSDAHWILQKIPFQIPGPISTKNDFPSFPLARCHE